MKLVADVGESANLAMLDGDQAIYVAQVPSKHQMRMFTEVGRRVPLHCTAVGKAMLAQLGNEEVREIVERAGMPEKTQFTITDPAELIAQLELVRVRGYGTDEGEQEVGVRCVAVPVLGAPSTWPCPSRVRQPGWATRFSSTHANRCDRRHDRSPPT